MADDQSILGGTGTDVFSGIAVSDFQAALDWYQRLFGAKPSFFPNEVEAGSELTFTNASDKEPHELVLFHIPDGEERSIDELLALPEAEAQAAVGAPVGVAFAAQPGSEGEVVEGELVVEEPGRYVALCFLPVGSTPESIEDENAQPSGPPHFTQGMKLEFTVQ